VTPAQCAKKYVIYTYSLAVWYATQVAVGCPAAAAICSDDNLQTNIDR